MTDKTTKLRVIDRYCHETNTYIEEEHDVHVCHIHVRYTNSKGDMVSMNMNASDFLAQYEITKK